MKTLTVDDRQRVRLPQAKPGQVFEYVSGADGTIKLVPVPVIAEPGPKRLYAKLTKQDGRLIFQLPKGYRLDPEAIAKAVAEERESRA